MGPAGKDTKKRRPASPLASTSSVPGTMSAGVDWDEPGTLSIIVQGALFQGNLIETANHCQHWRALFPTAQLILVISVTDVVMGTRDGDVYTTLRLVAKHRGDGHLEAALAVIVQSCTTVALADPALPLPPIKRDSPGPNNINFQIAAAQRGLALATGTYVLRLRSDMIFLDRSFLAQYIDSQVLPRKQAAIFKQRVLISWIYTLNPFTVERLPLHFSDWFHFGLAEDVRQIWDVPPVNLRDAIHYKAWPHDPESNAAERLFNIRVAVEQHVMYHCFKPHFPALTLSYHNDRSSVSLAMDILIDNFALCDLVQARCVFDKYAHEFQGLSKRVHCITPDSWKAMAQSRVISYQDMLLVDATQAVAASSDQQDRLPLLFEAHRLKTRAGEMVNGEIVARSPDGVLFYGPYVGLRSGNYTATVEARQLEGPGSLTLAATTNGGDIVLAKRSFAIKGHTPPRLELAFHVTAPFVSDLEIVGTLKGVRSMVVTAIRIAEGAAPHSTGSTLSVLRSVLRG